MALLLDPPLGLELMEEEVRVKRFPDLVVKCLIRATKNLSRMGPLIPEVLLGYMLLHQQAGCSPAIRRCSMNCRMRAQAMSTLMTHLAAAVHLHAVHRSAFSPSIC